MATFYMPIRDARVRKLPNGGAVVVFDLIAIAAARGWTLNVGDTIRTETIRPDDFCQGPLDYVIFQKVTQLSNADYVRIYGSIRESDIYPSITQYCVAPLHHSGVAGSFSAQSSHAGNHVGWAGTPLPYFQAAIDIVTAVSSFMHFWLFFITRAR